VNTLNSATITVEKDFSDDSSGEVTVSLTCESGDVTETDNTATETDDAEFLVEEFTAGDTCDASEGAAPAGYTKDESDCQNLVLGTDTSCEIVNTLNSATITVKKDFSDNSTDSVTVSLDCGAGVTVTAQGGDNTASEADPVEFTVDGFTASTRCDASETAPAGYTKDESDCQDVDPNAAAAADRECTIVNTKNPGGGGGGGGGGDDSTSITVDKDFSDDSGGEVTVTLDCGTATVTTVDGTATETDDAEFTVTGLDGDDTCTASEGAAPDGYTKNETDCMNFDPESKTSCTIVNTLVARVPNAPVPPVIDTEGNCLRRPVLAFVRGKAITKVVYELDGDRIGVVRRADREGRFGVRVDRRNLAPGKHELRATVHLIPGMKTRVVVLSVTVKPCLDKKAPKKIKTKGLSRTSACPASAFLAFVKGDTISSVTYRLNGQRLAKVEVADWKLRYAVKIGPAVLGSGTNTLEAVVRFIASAEKDPVTLSKNLPSCGK
jgi:hypothetical protein